MTLTLALPEYGLGQQRRRSAPVYAFSSAHRFAANATLSNQNRGAHSLNWIKLGEQEVTLSE
jgi:hypothetical protein